MSCITYTNQFTLLNIILPNFDIFNQLCTHTDKTYMFIIVMIRLLISIFIYHITCIYLSDNNITEQIGTVFVSLIIINVISICIVIMKIPIGTQSISESETISETKSEI